MTSKKVHMRLRSVHSEGPIVWSDPATGIPHATGEVAPDGLSLTTDEQSASWLTAANSATSHNERTT
jgi:hypothetical protein